MRIVDIITKKRDGGELTRAEIEFFIRGYVNGDVPDYQAAAFCMAVYFRGMTPAETKKVRRKSCRSTGWIMARSPPCSQPLPATAAGRERRRAGTGRFPAPAA